MAARPLQKQDWLILRQKAVSGLRRIHAVQEGLGGGRGGFLESLAKIRSRENASQNQVTTSLDDEG